MAAADPDLSPIPLSARLFAGIVVAIGIMVMLGWWLHQPLWVQIVPGFVGMVFNTALCFVLIGASLLFPARYPRMRLRVQRAIGAVVTVFAGLVLSQDLTGHALGIDQLFTETWLKDPNPTPGRMAPNTAAAFMVTGCVLLLMQRVRSRVDALLVHLLTFAVLFIAVTSLVIYATRPEFLYAGWRFTRMAVHTATGFALIGLALWGTWHRLPWSQNLYREREDLRIGIIAGVLLTAVALISGLSSFALLSQQAEQTLRRGLSLSLQNRIDLFTTEINDATNAARVIANRPNITQHLQRLQAMPNDAGEREQLRKTVSGLLPLGFSGLHFYAADGREMAAVGTRTQLTSGQRIPLARWSVELIWTDGFLLRLQSPIVADARRIGTLVAEHPLPTLTHMLLDYRGLGDSGEMAICGDARDYFDCFPLRAAPNVRLLPRMIDGQPLPMHYALLGKTGVVLAKDYRRQYVIAAYSPIGDLGLGMVLKMDTAELYRPIAAPLQLVFALLLALIAAAVIAVKWQVVPIARRLRQSEQETQRHNEALRESEMRFRAVTESANDAIIGADADGHITLWNRAAQQVFGYSAAEAIGQPLTLLMPKRYHAAHTAGLTRLVAGGTPRVLGRTVELHGQRKDGSEFPVELSLSSWQSPAGMHFTSLIRDITLRKKGEEAMAHLAAIVESSDDAIVSKNLDGTITSWNAAAERLFGYTAAEIVGRSVLTLSPPEQRGEEATFIEKIKRGERIVRDETVRRHKDGHLLHVALTVSPVRDGAGNIIGASKIARDISERRRAEQALKASERRLQLALRGSKHAVWDWDIQAGTVYLSEQWAAMLGEPSLPTNTTIQQLQALVHPDDRATIEDTLPMVLKGMLPTYHVAHRVRMASGDWKWVESVGEVVERDAAGRALRLAGSHTDITEHKRAEETIRQTGLVDELTGLQNRGGFYHRAEPALKLARRAKRDLYLFFVDLDGLKQINDSMGHAVGDAALVQTAKILRASFRDSDILARLGGDEFVVLALETGGDGAKPMLERVQRQVAAVNASGTHPFTLAMSIGAVRYDPALNLSLDQLLAQADSLMYQQKTKRRAERRAT